MKKNKRINLLRKDIIIIFTVFLMFILIILIFCFQSQIDSKEINNLNYNQNYTKIKYTYETKIISGDSMNPFLKNKQEVKLIKNYYDYNEPKKNDIIAFNFSGTKNPIIKVIRVMDEDFVEIIDNKLYINNHIMKNSIGEIYSFKVNEVKMLNLYITNNHIPKDTFFIFGDNIASSRDSRNFGAVTQTNMLGKFDILYS